MTDLRRTTYRVQHADRRQSVMDGAELESAIRAGRIGADDKVALGDGSFRPFWDYPRFAPFGPSSSSLGSTSSMGTPPPAARAPQPTGGNSSLGARPHTPAAPVATASISSLGSARREHASSAAGVAPVTRDPVAQAMQMAGERLRKDDVMSRLEDARRRLDSRSGSGAWTPLGTTPAPTVAPARPVSGAPNAVSSRASAAVTPVRTRAGSASSDHNRIDPLPAAAVRPAARTSAAAPRVEAPTAAGLDLVVAAIEETERHAPLLERKYGATHGTLGTDDRVDVNDTLEDALAEALSATPKRRALIEMPRRSEAPKAAFAAALLVLAGFLIWRSLQG